MDEKEKCVKEFYNSVGHRTQRKEFTTLEIAKYHKAENDYLKKYVKPSDKVLDIGCGEGRQLEVISSITEFLVGIDYSLPALDRARENNDGKILLVKADAKDLPFHNKYFDKAVCMFNTLGTMPKRLEVLKEACRILKDDGELLISVYSEEALESQLELYKKAGWRVIKHDGNAVYTKEGLISCRFNSFELAELVTDAGFKSVEIEKITPIAYVAVAKK